MRDDKKKINVVPIEPATHEALINFANQKGVAVNEFLGYLADTHFVSSLCEPKPDKPLQRAAWLSLQSKYEAKLRDEVYQAAGRYLERPTENGAERLAEQCDLMGLDYAEIISEIKSDPFSSMVEYSRNGSKTGDCIRFLIKEMNERKRFPAKLVFALGKQRGFNRSLVNSAKRAVNNDPKSPEIKSIRTSNGWDWAIDTE